MPVLETQQLTPRIASEVARRRTFAIISHPDAGKTTLTEKLLLYAGAIELAGAVRRKSQQRHARSDWMAMEQARGISVTSTVLQFDVGEACFNLLDTPGHQDFSEDTYRVLTAVDSAVMVLDAAKGIEPQTRKLFEVCRQRQLPVVTFVNKLDQPGREPLELLDEIEKVLGMDAVPQNWPIGGGIDFLGVYDFLRSKVLRFERGARGERAASVPTTGVDDPVLAALLGAHRYETFRDESELLAAAGHRYDPDRFLAGRQTPVFFGSALNNFGVEAFLEGLETLAPPPSSRRSNLGVIEPADDRFAGFVFKVQANMDPNHRDSMAFVRVVSGRFEKGMAVEHARLQRQIRLPRAHRIFAQERETAEEAFAGDVIGLVNPGIFTIGDTISEIAGLELEPLPSFPPEFFARLWPEKVDRHKAFQKGLLQLEHEGAIQVLFEPMRREPILAAVGELQFDLVRSRLEAEYGVTTRLERLGYRSALWVSGTPAEVDGAVWPSSALRAADRRGRAVALFDAPWSEQFMAEKNPGLELSRTH
ncbi:MAG: peptide chain release factor 3 [Acidobacteriota bacterium]